MKSLFSFSNNLIVLSRVMKSIFMSSGNIIVLKRVRKHGLLFFNFFFFGTEFMSTGGK